MNTPEFSNCPYFGQELPEDHHCPAGCPAAKECYETYQASGAPRPVCAECGQPLLDEDIQAGETVCLECCGAALLAEIKEEAPLVAAIKVKWGIRE